MSEWKLVQRRGRQSQKHAQIAKEILQSLLGGDGGKLSSGSSGSLGSGRKKGSPGSIVRGGQRRDGTWRRDEWICSNRDCACSNFLTNGHCRRCGTEPTAIQRKAGVTGSSAPSDATPKWICRPHCGHRPQSQAQNARANGQNCPATSRTNLCLLW